MARLLVYDAYENKVYTYSSLRENDPMPYSTGRTLTVREFRGKSNSPVLWTTIAAMEAWNLTRRKYGRGIPVGYAFRRIWEGGHGTRSQHYAGVAFDVGQSLSQTQRTAIYNAARSTGAWGYVEPLSQTPTWVHFDRRYGTPACRGTTAGYPTLRRGSRGCYVMILQDALSTLPVKFKSELKTLAADEAEVVFTAAIDKGWHVYSTDLGDGGPISATFNVEKISGAEVVGKLKPVGKEISTFDKLFEMKVRYFENTAQFVQKLKLTGGAYQLEGYLEYGACNDENCLPPTQVAFQFSGKAVASIHGIVCREIKLPLVCSSVHRIPDG